MPHDFVSFFVCNIEKLIVWCVSAKKNYYSLTKNPINFRQVSLKGVLLSKFRNIAAKSCKSTCEKVKSLKRLNYIWTFSSQVTFKISSKIFLTSPQKSVCILYGHIYIRIHICKTYFFPLLLFLRWKAKEK